MLEMDWQFSSPDKAMTAIVTGAELYLPLAGLIDIAQEIARLDKELQTLHGEVERVEKKLAMKALLPKLLLKLLRKRKPKLADYADKRDKVIARIRGT